MKVRSVDPLHHERTLLPQNMLSWSPVIKYLSPKLQILPSLSPVASITKMSAISYMCINIWSEYINKYNLQLMIAVLLLFCLAYTYLRLKHTVFGTRISLNGQAVAQCVSRLLAFTTTCTVVVKRMKWSTYTWTHWYCSQVALVNTVYLDYTLSKRTALI